tara:strand:+ start:2050 stop:2181 length:132 start_codon:yes stop_codon:yes gene_type:complete
MNEEYEALMDMPLTELVDYTIELKETIKTMARLIDELTGDEEE